MSSTPGSPRLLCLIPARGGSKRIPKKNIRLFAGKPMLSWPLDIALKATLFHDVVVSTDDPQIAAIAQSLGAWVPFIRAAKLSDDYTSTAAVTCDALASLSELGSEYDYVCCLYPTAVFTSMDDLSMSFQALSIAGCSTCLAVTPYGFSPFRALVEGGNERLHFLFEKYQEKRSQDLPETLHDAGQFCWSRARDLLASKKVSMDDAIGHVMKKGSVIDIDDEDDLYLAELLFLRQRRP